MGLSTPGPVPDPCNQSTATATAHTNGLNIADASKRGGLLDEAGAHGLAEERASVVIVQDLQGLGEGHDLLLFGFDVICYYY